MDIDVNRLPSHIAIIMDGNGRWANKQGLPRQLGHRKGSDTLLKTIKYANELGIKYLTVFAFSTENWNRPKKEVDYLMNLASQMFDKNQKEFKKTNIKTNVIGDLKRLPVSLQEKINEGILRSKDRNGLIFTVALSYGSREEIVSSAKRLALDVLNEKININDINEEVFSSYLYTCNLPDVDLLIRTSGEKRISNFLLWQLSYSELYFTNTYWPDFSKDEFDQALNFYSKCERRFGGLK
ncbi:MAG TPA: isoprenyl transferase [Acholeplasmataceae bacterium]|nr:isoprenyl transferase [Acholeplasmataceae bacterium]